MFVSWGLVAADFFAEEVSSKQFLHESGIKFYKGVSEIAEILLEHSTRLLSYV